MQENREIKVKNKCDCLYKSGAFQDLYNDKEGVLYYNEEELMLERGF